MSSFDRVLGALPGLTVTSPGYARGRCPVHGGDGNFGVFYNGSRVVMTCFSHGCSYPDILAATGLTSADLYDNPDTTYTYSDGRVVHRQTDVKGFYQTGNKGGTALYHVERLPDDLTVPVYLVEGEEDVHSIEAVGGYAVSGAMGAGNIGRFDFSPLQGRQVIAVMDADEPGDKWATAVVDALGGHCTLTKAALGKDVSDHLAAGLALDALVPVAFTHTPDPLEVEVERQLLRMRATDEAKRLRAEEQFAAMDLPEIGLLSDLKDLPEDAWIIEGLQRNSSLIEVIAQKKTGKTAFSVNWCHSLLTGKKFLNLWDVHPITGRVGYMNYEVDAAEIKGTMDDLGVPDDRVVVVNLEGKANLLATAPGRKMLVERFRELDVQALVIDPFNDASKGIVLNQNDVSEVNEFRVVVDELRSALGLRATLLNVHSGWGTEGKDPHARGSSGLEDWASALLRLQRDSDTGDVRLSAEGRRGVTRLNKVATFYNPDTSEVVVTSTEPAPPKPSKRAEKADKDRGAVLSVLTAVGGLPFSKYVDQVVADTHGYVTKGAASRALESLLEDGTLTETRGPNNARLLTLNPGGSVRPSGSEDA